MSYVPLEALAADPGPRDAAEETFLWLPGFVAVQVAGGMLWSM
jgi:hypothetical protein